MGAYTYCQFLTLIPTITPNAAILRHQTNLNQEITMKIKLKSHVPIVAFALIGGAGLSHAATSANLLVHPGFESPASLSTFATVVSDFTANQGIWGAEDGSFTTTENSVTPLGTRMLKMVGSGSTYETIQITSLADYIADIDAGNATFDMTAMFNTPSSPISASGGLVARFFTTGWDPGGPVLGNSESVDGDPSTWQQIALSGAIPAGTRWIGTQVSYNGASLDLNPGYVDNASLTVTTIPEPSSTALLGLGFVGLAFRRSRR